MSLILDALNKADREREYRDAVPDLNTVHGVVRSPRSRHPAWMIGGLAAAVLMVVVLLVLLWLRQTDPAPAEPAAPREPVAASTQVAALEPGLPSITAGGSQETPAMVAAPPDEEVQALYQPQQEALVMEVVEPQVQAALEEPTIIMPEVPRSSTVDEDLARALWEESRQEMQQPVPDALLQRNTAIPEPKPAEEPKPLPADLPVEETLAGHTDVPFLHELPVSVQNTIPTLMYAKHEYDEGFVIINKEELQVGSAAQGGVLLERILADGVLLSLDGTEFKLSSLSSWVNY